MVAYMQISSKVYRAYNNNLNNSAQQPWNFKRVCVLQLLSKAVISGAFKFN